VCDLVPERVGEQQAGLDAVEGHHQGGEFTVEADGVEHGVEVVERALPQRALVHAQVGEIRPAERLLGHGGRHIGDGEAGCERVRDVGAATPAVNGQDRNDVIRRNLHISDGNGRSTPVDIGQLADVRTPCDLGRLPSPEHPQTSKIGKTSPVSAERPEPSGR